MDQKPQSRLWGAVTLRFAGRALGLPTAWRCLPPLVYGAVVLGLRVTGSGLDSGSAGLILLGVLWLALQGTRTRLLVTLVISAGVFLGPVVTLPSRLGAGELPLALIWTIVTGLVGLTVSHLVHQTRRASVDAMRKAAVLLERETALRSVSELARRMFAEPDARGAVCRAAAQIATADRVSLLEPDDHRRLTVSATCGAGVDAAGSGARIAFTSGQTFVVPDTGAAEGVGADRSIVFQPVLRDAAPTALLVVAWRSARDVVSDHVLAALELLAAEAAVAIERADLMTELAIQARSDALTGLGNRRRWDERLEHDLAHARRSREPLSVALLDLDRFKRFNDRYGHQAGDRLLKEAAAGWRHTLRDSDTLVRWGGEEFAVLLPRCSAAEAHALLERLRARTPGGQTCSAGVAEWDREEGPEALVDRADRALYAAKRRGRDQVVVASRTFSWEGGAGMSTLDVDLGEHPLPA